jgi:hypothetical protein
LSEGFQSLGVARDGTVVSLPPGVSCGGSGRTIAQGGLSISGTATKTLTGRPLDNASTATVSGVDVDVGSKPVLEALAGVPLQPGPYANAAVFNMAVVVVLLIPKTRRLGRQP